MSGDPQAANGRKTLAVLITSLVVVAFVGWTFWHNDDVNPTEPSSVPTEFVAAHGHGTAYAPCWHKARTDYVRLHPQCEVEGCGETKGLECHHIHPHHLYPKLQCDPRNLVTLCGRETKNDHHLKWGHLSNYESWNVNIRAWCAHPPTQAEIDKATRNRP